MNITNQHLNYLGIESMTLEQIGKPSIRSCLVKHEKHCWTLMTEDSLKNYDKEAPILLQINLITKQSISVDAKIVKYGENFAKIMLPKGISSKEWSEMITTLYEIDYEDKKYGRRKEPRIEIGKKNRENFELKNLEQTAIFTTSNRQSCVILDASIHGIKILTLSSVWSRNKKNFLLKIDFDGGKSETVMLEVHRVHLFLDKKTDRTFAQISCQILEPIPYSWKKRVIELLKKMH